MWGVLPVPSSSPTLSPIYDGLDVNVTSNVTWFHLNHDMVSRRIYKLSFYGGHSITLRTCVRVVHRYQREEGRKGAAHRDMKERKKQDKKKLDAKNKLLVLVPQRGSASSARFQLSVAWTSLQASQTVCHLFPVPVDSGLRFECFRVVPLSHPPRKNESKAKKTSRPTAKEKTLSKLNTNSRVENRQHAQHRFHMLSHIGALLHDLPAIFCFHQQQ